MTGLLLQPVGPEDAERLAPLRLGFLAAHGASEPLEKAVIFFRDFLSFGYGGVAFVRDARDIGYALWLDGCDNVLIRHFFLVEDMRGQGLGRACFDRLRAEHLPDRGELRLDVRHGMDATLAFWERMGFTNMTAGLRLEYTQETN